MTNHYKQEIFFYHVVRDDKNKSFQLGDFWITSNYGFLRHIGSYSDFLTFCATYNISPFFAD